MASLVFFMAFFLHAEEEKTAEEQNSSRRVLFDLSKQKKDSLKEMCNAQAKGLVSATECSKGSIFSTTAKLSSFFVPFEQNPPPVVKLWLEGDFYLSDASGVDSDIARGAIRVGFKTPKVAASSVVSKADTSYAMSVALFKGAQSKVGVVVFSGPLQDRGQMLGENEAAAKQVIYSSNSTEITYIDSEPVKLKIMADGESHEISVWINKQLIFKGKSAYDSVEGDMCPLDSILGFYINFAGQNPFGTESPAYAKDLLCYYTSK